MEEEYLYHYTSATSILGIFTNRAIWASDYSYLNDGLEGKLIPALLRKMGERPEIHGIQAEQKFADALIKHLGWGKNFYLASFSKRPNVLTQFRMYCPLAGGYVIGFPKSFLARAGKLVDVEYDQTNHVAWCRSYFARFVEAARTCDAFDKSVEQLAYDTICTGPWVEERTSKGIACKSDEFQSEQEVRLLDTQTPIEPHLRASANGSLFIPYVPIPLPNEPIQVRLAAGPSRFPDLAMRGVQQLIHVARRSGSQWEPCLLGIGEFGYRDLG